MVIRFQNRQAENYFTGDYKGKQPFPETILRSFRHKVNLMENAQNINQLSRIRSLNVERYGDHWSIRINEQYRIEFDFIKPDYLLIIEISKHYE